jgi:hypothetical protein
VKVPRLLVGGRWAALVVAGGLVAGVIVFAPLVSAIWSQEAATVAAFAGFVAVGLIAFFWASDRASPMAPLPGDGAGRAKSESPADVPRKARIRPRLDYEMTQESAGEGFFRNTIWLVNRGPGGAAALRLTFDALTEADVGTRPPGEVWSDPAVLARARRFGPFRRPGLAVGGSHRVPIFRDSDNPSTGGIRLPLGSSDVAEYSVLRVKVECTDGSGAPVDAVFDILQKAAGYYEGPTGQRRWVDSWRLLS